MSNPDLNRQPFSHKGPFTVTRPFRLGGVDYSHGETFFTTKVAVGNRKLRQLFDARYINMAGDETTPPVVPQPADDTKPLEAGAGQFLYDPEKHAVEKHGRDQWIADEANLLVQISTKAATRLKKESKPTIVTVEEIVAWPEGEEEEDETEDDEEDGESEDDESEDDNDDESEG